MNMFRPASGAPAGNGPFMTTTLQDIADVVGVSRVTVSRVLRGKVKGCWPKSAAQAERIRQVAQELNYRVDWRARTLKTGRTHMIGLLSTDKPQTQTHSPELLTGLIDELGLLGYHLTFVRVRPDADGSSSGDDFADSRFDGLLIDYHLEEEELRVVQEGHAPAVIINAPTPEGFPGGGGIESVMPDHEAAGRLAAEHLLELGHRRIAWVSSPTSELDRWPQHMYDAWRAGFRAAMRDAGVADGYREIVAVGDTVDKHPAAYERALSEAFADASPPTALLSANASQAASILLPNLRLMGLRCPEDVSVLVMGSQPEASWTTPELSCLHLPFRQVGEAAARRLVAAIEGHEPDPSDTFDLRVDARGSTGPAPERA